MQYVFGPVLVLAGAGSGKTSVITQKIAWLIKERGVPAENIVAVTFTNKAAREMKIRVSDLMTGKNTRKLQISTFHALGLNILRHHLDAAGYRPGFSIYDTEDSRALIAKLLRVDNPTAKNLCEPVQWQISRWKSALVLPDHAAAMEREAGSVADLGARIYQKYEQHLIAYNAMDFDDLILKPIGLLRKQAEILDEWRERIHYLLVDEYQDTNTAQYELVKLLVGDKARFTVVGDDDQSIYAWRGAQPTNLRQLKQEFPALMVIKLEQNYRSTGRILKTANALIANNPHIYEKALWCDSTYGEPLRVIKARSEEHEAERIVGELLHHKFKHGTEFRDYAILFRNNHQTRVFERVLREQRIPYFLSGATSFFDKTEVKDIMAYLRLLCNPDDDNAFLRVVNTPRREIGPATLEQLAKYATEMNLSLLRASLDPLVERTLAPRQIAALRAFAQWLADTIERAKTEDAVKLTCDILADLHYEDWLKDTCNDQKIAARRMENVLELVAWLQRLARQQRDEKSLSDLVASLCLVGLLEKDSDENPGDYVSVMTLHAAKGLEFPHVFMVGMEENLLPHHASQDATGLEEERRLAYVGITRARKTLTFSYSERRRRGGEIAQCQPSRFFAELPQDDLLWVDQETAHDPEAMIRRGEVYLANLRSMLGDERR